MTSEELFAVEIKEPDAEIRRLSKERWDGLAKPIDGLGFFEEMVSRIAAAQGSVIPDLTRKALIVMCADNGVFEEGISQTKQSVTRDVAGLMGEGKSSVGMMLKGRGVSSFIYDIGINCEDSPRGVLDVSIRKGTGNFVKESAMTEAECLMAIETGIRAAGKCSEGGYGIIATGEMGIGNTTTSTALLCALKGLDPAEYTGRGAGLSEEGLQNKIRVIERGIRLHRGDRAREAAASREEVFEMLQDLGGLDIAGLTGVFIGGGIYHIPVVIDGLITAVAALIAEWLVPGCQGYMIASHLGREKGMEMILDELSLKPVINAGMALGEGTGAVLLLPMLDMVMSLYSAGTAFSDTQIQQYERFE